MCIKMEISLWVIRIICFGYEFEGSKGVFVVGVFDVKFFIILFLDGILVK